MKRSARPGGVAFPAVWDKIRPNGMKEKIMKSKRSICGLVLLLAAGLLVVAACGRKTPSEKAGEKMLSDMLSKATGSKTQVDLRKGEIKVKTADGDAVITSGGGTWPANLPEEIPQFRAGAILQSTNHQRENGTSWMVMYRDVEADALDAYIEDLKSDGWTVMLTTETGNGKYTQLQTGHFMMTVTYTADEKAASLSIVESANE
jgi:hypothetical protein